MAWVRILEGAPDERGYETGEVVQMGSNAAIWKERGWAAAADPPQETTSRRPPENTARRTRPPEDEKGVCGAELSSGGVCSREADNGRCWQHTDAS